MRRIGPDYVSKRRRSAKDSAVPHMSKVMAKGLWVTFAEGGESDFPATVSESAGLDASLAADWKTGGARS